MEVFECGSSRHVGVVAALEFRGGTEGTHQMRGVSVPLFREVTNIPSAMYGNLVVES